MLNAGDNVWTNLWSKIPNYWRNNTELSVNTHVPEPTTANPTATTKKQQIVYVPLNPSQAVYVPTSYYTSYIPPPYPISYHNPEPYQYQYQYQDPSVFQSYSYGNYQPPPALMHYDSKLVNTPSAVPASDPQIEYLEPQNDNSPSSSIIQPDQLKGFYAHIKKLAQLSGVQLEEEHEYKGLKPEQPRPNIGDEYKGVKPVHEVSAEAHHTEVRPTVTAAEPTTLYMARNVTDESRHLDEDQLDIRAPVPTYGDVVNWVQNFTNEWVNMQVNQRNESAAAAVPRPEQKPTSVYMFRDKDGNLCTKELVAQAEKMYNVVMCEQKGYGDEELDSKRTTLYKSDVTYFTDEMERSEEPLEMAERSSAPLTTEPSLLD